MCVCVCLCLCVCVRPEISRTGGCIATLLILSWRALPGELHKLLLEPTRHAVWKKKPLEAFRQLRIESHACTVILPITLGRKNLAHYQKAVGTFSKGMRWRTHPQNHGYHSCCCFLREWAIITPQYEKLLTHKRPTHRERVRTSHIYLIIISYNYFTYSYSNSNK